MMTNPVIPIEREKITDKSCPAQVLVSYMRLLARAWDGQALNTLALDFDTELLDVLGVSRTQAKQHLRWLKFGKWIGYERLGGRVRITFPMSADAQVGIPTPIEREVGIPTPLTALRLNSESINDVSDPETKFQLPIVLAAGGVFPWLTRQVSEHLMADEKGGRWWLRAALGWVAYYKKHAVKNAGALMFKSLTDDRPVPPPQDFFPPDSLGFDEALKWAMRGGAPVEEHAHIDQPDEWAATQAPTPPVNESVNALIDGSTYTWAVAWQAAKGQLRLEMPSETFDTWLFGAEAVNYSDGVLTICVRDQYKADWLTHRMMGTVKRVVSGLAGESVGVKFIAPQEVEQ